MCKSVLLSQRSNKEKDTLYANTKLDQGIYTTVCPRSSGPFYVVTYYIKWVTTSWTSMLVQSVTKCSAHGTVD